MYNKHKEKQWKAIVVNMALLHPWGTSYRLEKKGEVKITIQGSENKLACHFMQQSIFISGYAYGLLELQKIVSFSGKGIFYESSIFLPKLGKESKVWAEHSCKKC